MTFFTEHDYDNDPYNNHQDHDGSYPCDVLTSNLISYLSCFDGTPKTFADVQYHFENLFSDQLIHTMDGSLDSIIDKRDFIRYFVEFMLRNRMVATLEDLYFVDDSHLEYTVHWSNGEGCCESELEENGEDLGDSLGTTSGDTEDTGEVTKENGSDEPNVEDDGSRKQNEKGSQSSDKRKGMSMVFHSSAVFGPDGKIVKVQPCEETKGVFANLGSFRLRKEKRFVGTVGADSDKENVEQLGPWWKGALSSSAVNYVGSTLQSRKNDDGARVTWLYMRNTISRGLVRPPRLSNAFENK